MADYLGIVAIIVFYLLILAVGIWAGRKTDAQKVADGQHTEEVMLAGRNIGTLVGIFTMTGINLIVFS
jgi:high affinity choline transporter 7